MSTAPLSYEDYALSFLKLIHHFDEILFIHCSSELSDFYNIALRVRDDFAKNNSCRIEVLDSRLCGMGLGLAVIAAAEAFQEGKSISEVLPLVEETITRIKCYMAIPTLEYLRRNKKIGGLKTMIGARLGVKPVVGFKKGRLVVLNKLFGEQKNMILAMLDTLKEEIDSRPITLAIAHARDTSLVNSIHDVFDSTFQCNQIFTLQFGPSIGISTGSETIGVAYYTHPE
jgi:DegV family protein with EDD domain